MADVWPVCPDCQVKLVYDIVRDEWLCEKHGQRFWRFSDKLKPVPPRDMQQTSP